MQHADFINTLNTLFDETWYRDEIMTAVEEQRKKDATGIESIQDSEVSIQKVIRDGQLYIVNEGTMYNAQGAEVK